MATALVDYPAPTYFENNPILIKKNPLVDHHHGAAIAKQMIGDAFRQRVESIDHESCNPGEEDTFLWVILARCIAST